MGRNAQNCNEKQSYAVTEKAIYHSSFKEILPRLRFQSAIQAHQKVQHKCRLLQCSAVLCENKKNETC